ncbi:MAG: orotate phosphoribosyltransferase [Kiritimatiellae bacterium]|nr:orotate phosphoribosyltransferase [Kiritimatiellia bacterium]
MTEEEVLKTFADTGALLEGHFELRSKLHSNRYFQCANVLRYPRIAGRLCDELVAKMKAACDIGRVDGVISPAVGGILVGHEVARALDVKCVFAEKVQGEGVDATGKPVTKLAMRRFALQPGERYVVAEDVVTKGGRVQETVDLVRAAGAEVAAIVLLVDRSMGAVKFGDVPMFSLVQIQPVTWEPAECPLCAAGGKPVHPGS